MRLIDRAKGCVTAVVLCCAAVAGGCSPGDVELNGSIFDKLGVGSNSAARSDTKVPIRQALVLPPNLERLPEPGSGQADQQSAEAMPVDPEQKRVAAVSKAEADHRAYCERALREAKVRGDLTLVKGPLGRCDRSALDNVNINSPISIQTGSNPPAKP